MTLELLPQQFSVCKAASLDQIDLSHPFCFVGKTDEELSLVCETRLTPAHTLEREDGWRCLRIAGTLDFSLVGVLAGIAAVLATAGVSIFALSTFNTDYLLIRSKDCQKALSALSAAGYGLSLPPDGTA